MGQNKKKKFKDTIFDCVSDSEIEFPEGHTIKRSFHPLAYGDRLTYVYGLDGAGHTIAVINVSYEILISKRWVTIIRMDSAHGFLHRHARFSLENEMANVENVSMPKKGTQKELLRWAIKNLSFHFYEYKIHFCKNSNIDISQL